MAEKHKVVTAQQMIVKESLVLQGTMTRNGQTVDSAVLLGTGEVVDLNGEAYGLVLDADADTAIGASVDDVINIKVAGAEDFRIAANLLTALSGSVIATNTISETTAASGVTIDSVLLKDGGATLADATALSTDIISEKVAAAGVTIDGVLLKDSQVTTDVILEKTAAAGVTADGVLLKDGTTNARSLSQDLTASGAITVGRNGVVTLAHATVVIAATLAAPTAGDELLIVNTSASGTVAHTVTLPAGVTFNAAGNNTATLDAAEEALHIKALSTTRWLILTNIDSVGLSTVP